MKASVLKGHLKRLVDALFELKADRAARALRSVEAVLPDRGTLTVEGLAEEIARLEIRQHGAFATRVAEARASLTAFTPVFSGCSTKTFTGAIELFENALGGHDNASLDAFVAALQAKLSVTSSKPSAKAGKSRPSSQTTSLREDVVQKHVQALGSEKDFAAAFDRLVEDKLVRAKEAAAIATKVAIKTAASTPKKESFARIQQAHQARSVSDARSKYFSGQSAA